MLKQFAKEWLSWADNPVVHPAFRKQLTLCGCLQEWSKTNSVPGSAASKSRKDLIKHLTTCYGTANTPFGGPLRTLEDCKAGTMHMNPTRRAFIRELAMQRDGEEPILVVYNFGNIVAVRTD